MAWTILGNLLVIAQLLLSAFAGSAHVGLVPAGMTTELRSSPRSSLLTDSTDASSVSQITSISDYQAELMSLIKTPGLHEPEFFQKAATLIQSQKSVPSCALQAAMTLLGSCRDIDGSNDNGHGSTGDHEGMLERIKSTYAARLAVCELLEAGADVPAQCSSLTSPKRPKTARSFSDFLFKVKRGAETAGDGKADDAKDALSQCLWSLESRPQWWTSYSNSRQNAVVMCQAMRGQIERGECWSPLPAE